MNEPSISLPERAALLQPVRQARRDVSSSAVVERGIAVQAAYSTVCAVEYLQAHNVAQHIIERVLLHPGQRRRPPVTH